MADKTITQLTATTSAATADEIPIWVAGSAVTRKITKANFLQGAFTGGGTVATGGYTLTVPATGTAALLATAQTFSALKTFSAGISLGAETLSTYDEGTWTPALNFGGAATGITYSTQVGNYIKIGKIVIVNASLVVSNVGSATGAATVAGFPFAQASGSIAVFPVFFGLMNTNMIAAWIFHNTTGTSPALRYQAAAAASISSMSNSDFATSSLIYFSGAYIAGAA